MPGAQSDEVSVEDWLRVGQGCAKAVLSVKMAVNIKILRNRCFLEKGATKNK
jgi:hypothetical protein